jgi:hypothetical protein
LTGFFVVTPYPVRNYRKPARTVYSDISVPFVEIGLGQQNGQQMVNNVWCEGTAEWLSRLGSTTSLSGSAGEAHTSITGMKTKANGYRRLAVMVAMINVQR